MADPLGTGPALFPLLPGAVSTLSGITFCPSFFSPGGVTDSFLSAGLSALGGSCFLSCAGSGEGGSGITGWLGATGVGGGLVSGGEDSTGSLEGEELTDAGGFDFRGELAFGAMGTAGFSTEGLLGAGETGLLVELTSGRTDLAVCSGAGELVDTTGPEFDGEPNHFTTV